MIWDEELNDRKKAILKSIIDDYVRSAQPVGSRTISKKQELGLSSATIRNEMSDLEELGYIAQPHTSAGRIPSDKGYRFYVDNLMQIQELARDEILSIRNAMNERIGELGDLVRRASSIVSTMTGYTAMVLTPSMEGAVIKNVQLIHVDRNKVLVVLITSGGVANNKLVRLGHDVDEQTLVAISNMMVEQFGGKKVHDFKLQTMAQIEATLQLPDGIVLPIMDGLRDCLKRVEHADIYLEGMTNLFNYPEFSDMIRTREILELLKEEEVIGAVLKAAINKHKMDMRIGTENELLPFKDLSLITTSYGSAEQPLGAIAILGPTRMAYSRVVSSLDYVKKLLDREIAKLFVED